MRAFTTPASSTAAVSPTAVNRIAVVVPAHNEEDLVADCVTSVLVAARNTPHEVAVTVVLDDCTDATARRIPLGVQVISCSFGSVGAARREGFARHGTGRAVDDAATWFASTDADSRVPPHWFQQQLHFADHGADCYLGTVTPDGWTGWTRDVERRYTESYRNREGHSHIHGANLGMRAATYHAVGGFAPIPHGEDVELVHRVRAFGARVVASHHAPVITSTRAQGRAEHGFAAHLRSLDSASCPAPSCPATAQTGGYA
ncbi:glycosyltransferase [Gordonia sputi]|uniref:glycosyltransferase n=1 Tax=Gordonia sputi TaxID=36823 RepID=UPI000A2F2CE5|nr:glycosyltransferase [Gordonia sputi]NKY93591.1 glycosyltransferase [Gordonia sputi]